MKKRNILKIGALCALVMFDSLLAKDAPKLKIEKPKSVKSISSDIEIITSDNSDGKITPKTIEEAFKKAGFTISANRNMNGPFVKQFKDSGFDIYNLFTFYKADSVLALAKKYPNVGLFAPMSMSIYAKKGEKTISVSSLTVAAMAKIMKAPSDDKTLIALRKLVKETLKSALPKGTFATPKYEIQKPKGELVTTFTMEMDKDEWDDELDEFKMGFEGELAPNGFVIAGFNNLGDDFDDLKYDAYDFYEVYSVCKLPVIYTIAKMHPEAGAFAPCSLYMSKKKNDVMLHVAFPSVYNWMSSMSITNKDDIKVLEGAQAGMKKILKGLTE